MSRQSQSLSARLTRMNLLVSGAVLLIAATAFFSYDVFSFRRSLIRNLDAQVQIIGENSVSALTFNDEQTATATLQSLQSSPDVLAATLVRNDGKVFAQYGAVNAIDGKAHALGASENDRVWAAVTSVVVAHRIVFQGKSMGVVCLAAKFGEIGKRARQYLVITLVILLFCMLAAIFISAISRRLIAEPISALAEAAEAVSRDKDYSVRAEVQADASEIGVLVDAFNTMLEQIQERDAKLNEARADLELRVEERTAELQTANRELEAFSYTVAHDLRGPLDAISGIAFLLLNTSSGEDRSVRPMLEQLKTSTAHMGTLIDDLLNFARASTTVVRATSVDLSAIARAIVAELKTSDPQREVEISVAEMPELMADAGLMRIVMDNLLRNAWKYTSRHAKACIEVGAIQTFRADGSPGKLVYFVRDDGAGFDPARMEKLFQPFSRLHGKAEFPGTGIGLATVQRILARQGGSIWAEGAIEKGATFFFTVE